MTPEELAALIAAVESAEVLVIGPLSVTQEEILEIEKFGFGRN